MANIDILAENIAELLTNSVNMTEVFYDLFINPTPMEVTLYQYDSNNTLVEVKVPNRAQDRKIAIEDTVPPTSSEKAVDAPVGVCYVNTADDDVYFKISEDASGWLKVALQDDIDTAVASVLSQLSSYVLKTTTVNGYPLSSDVSLSASDVGALSEGTSYGSSLDFSNSELSLLDQNGNTLGSPVDLSPVSGMDTGLINISPVGISRLNASKGYQTGTEAHNDSLLYNYIKGLFDASSTTGTDTYSIEGSVVSIPYRLSKTGSKITTSDYLSNIQSVYAVKGSAPYYVLDTTNELVYIPMGELYGMIENASNKINRNIGEIIISAIPLSDAGLHELDGTRIYETGVNAAFYAYMYNLYLSHTSDNCFCTEAEWQASVESYGGVCGKFAFGNDTDGNYVRLPKVMGFIEGASSISELGSLVEAGLPNITGAFSAQSSGVSGSFYVASSGTTLTGSGWANRNQTGFDASRSNSVYGNSNTVQPQSVKVMYYIVLANSARTDIEVNIDNVITDLNGKADKDLSNMDISPVVRSSFIEWVMPDYNNAISYNDTNVHTAPNNGFLFIDAPAADCKLLINGILVATSVHFSNSNTGITGCYPLSKGDTFNITVIAALRYYAFMPAKGEE